MLRSVKDARGVTVGASDGDIGRVDDLYFDDVGWGIRYVVVDTGTWLLARRVLISPIALGPPDWRSQRLPVSLTKEQVRNSPAIDTQKPVSRQHEAEYSRYFGYPYYWVGTGLWGMGADPRHLITAAALQPEVDAPLAEAASASQAEDSHLRSCAAVTGYHIEATDGAIGHVADFLVDDHSWAIHYVVVDTSNWWSGHNVMFAPQWLDSVNWLEKSVSVDLTMDTIRNAPVPGPIEDLDGPRDVDQHEHTRRQGYWATETDRVLGRSF